MARTDADRLASGMSRHSLGPPYPTSQNTKQDLMPSSLVNSSVPREPPVDDTYRGSPIEHSIPNRFHHGGRAATNGLLDSSLGLRAGSSSWGSIDGYPPVSHIPPPGPSTAAPAEPKPPSCKFNMSLVHEGPDGATRSIGLKLQVPPTVTAQGFDESVEWTGNLLGKLTQDVANRWERFQTCSTDWREDLVEGFPENDVYKLLNQSNAWVSVGQQTGVPDSVPHHGTEVTVRRSDGSHFLFRPSAGDVVEVVPESYDSNTRRVYRRPHEPSYTAGSARPSSAARSFVRSRSSRLAEGGSSDIGPPTAESILAPPMRTDDPPAQQTMDSRNLVRDIVDLIDQEHCTIDDPEYLLYNLQVLQNAIDDSRQGSLRGESRAGTTMPSRVQGFGRGLRSEDTFDLPLIDE